MQIDRKFTDKELELAAQSLEARVSGALRSLKAAKALATAMRKLQEAAGINTEAARIRELVLGTVIGIITDNT